MDKLATTSATKIAPQNLDPVLLDRLAQALSGLRFGSVEIVIQDGRVVQIERKEKFRLDSRDHVPARVTA